METTKQTPEQKAWLEARRHSIGASEAAAVLGLHPWLSPIEVWLAKVHPEMVEPRDNFLLRLGTRLEPVIAAFYEDETGRKLEKPNQERTVHPDYPEISASPDRLVVREAPSELFRRRLVELKSCNEFRKDEFGDFGSQEVPRAYLIQAWVQMEVTRIPICDIAALLGGAKFGIYVIPEDKEVQQAIIDQLREWWHKYVVAKVEPPVDPSPVWARYIERRHPRHTESIIKIDPAAQQMLAKDFFEYFNVRAALTETQIRLDLYENRLKLAMGDAEGLEDTGGRKITWRRSKDTVQDVTDWRATFTGLCTELLLPYERQVKLIERYTEKGVITRKGSRRFLPKEGK